MPFTVTVPPQMAEELLEAAHRRRLKSEGPVLTQIIGILWPLLRQINYDFGALETFVQQHSSSEQQAAYLPVGSSEKDSRFPPGERDIVPGIAPVGELGEQEAWVIRALRKIREKDPGARDSILLTLSERAEDFGLTEELPGHGAIVDPAKKHRTAKKIAAQVRSATRRET